MTETQTQARTFDRETVTQVLNEVVAEFGEHYVYPRRLDALGCVYAVASEDDPDEFAPSCIVGQVIARIDPEAFQELGALEARLGSKTARFVFLDESSPLFGRTDDLAIVNGLYYAQSEQDLGGTWGDALARYRYEVDNAA
ncbi:hypothetical protein SEA_CECE_317 [Microbacterium phage Cece]|nr:hypothetical protein SEA_CECE_15 [Microbacterium phage Cece]UVG35323.1 hypothetical protein SEA_CECE_317 [Microbacterium phage Cece]